ncbi:hypothetical protein D7V88_40825 [Corallococcus terminator]|uniref:Uncharacterized protein n=1 Tax=Corallococcus terminator TaxID=2316733 RepID=A0A3A8HKN7_9BACT|nr:hypothetical protein D7V88_40825 [Corallococcus terminator]
MLPFKRTPPRSRRWFRDDRQRLSAIHGLFATLNLPPHLWTLRGPTSEAIAISHDEVPPAGDAAARLQHTARHELLVLAGALWAERLPPEGMCIFDLFNLWPAATFRAVTTLLLAIGGNASLDADDPQRVDLWLQQHHSGPE